MEAIQNKETPGKVRKMAEIIAAVNNLPVGLVEKDIWITYALREIFSLPEAKHLVFKGGTCLVKAYCGYYRFSEDIDLTWANGKVREHAFRKAIIEKVRSQLGLEWDYHDKVKTGMAGTHSGGIMNYFFLTPKNGSTPSKLKITVAFDEKLSFQTERRKLRHIEVNREKERELVAMFDDVARAYFGPLEVPCYSLQEIGAEKIRAVLTRKLQPVRSRDLFDLYKMGGDNRLAKIAPPDAVKAKLFSALKIPAYAAEYKRNIADLRNHLQQLAVQAALDPVFIEKPDVEALKVFAEKLEKYIKSQAL